MNHVLSALLLGKRRVAKAHGAHTHSRSVQWRGLTIGIENDVGSTRRGTGPEGAWSTTMLTPYGEIAGTVGVDGDPLDVFVNESGLDACTHAYVVHTAHPATGRYDEDKVMLGFSSPDEAVACFAAHYAEPHRHFGALTSVSLNTFLQRCADPARKGQSFTNNTESRVALGRRRVARLRAIREERSDWMRALVAKAHGVRTVAKGLSVGEAEERHEQISAQLGSLNRHDDAATYDELAYQRDLLAYSVRARTREVGKGVSFGGEMPGEDRDLYIRIWPGRDAVDLQGQVIPMDLIYKSWAYYVECGNIDLEHISKSGGKKWLAGAAKIEAAGFDPKHRFARVQYEIGRPVPGSLRVEEMNEAGEVVDFSFVAKIHGGGNEAAQWFRSTLPDIPWKPSVGGQMSEPVKVIGRVNDPRLGIDREQEVEIARDFRFNNTAMTLEPVNHWVRPIEILSDAEAEALLAGVPHSPEKVTA